MVPRIFTSYLFGQFSGTCIVEFTSFLGLATSPVELSPVIHSQPVNKRVSSLHPLQQVDAQIEYYIKYLYILEK